jgi:phosphoribosylformylglycinamidine cyclo-ligase
MELTFNLGVGMIAVVPATSAADALDLAAARGVAAWRLGEVVEGDGSVQMISEYAGPAATW